MEKSPVKSREKHPRLEDETEIPVKQTEKARMPERAPVEEKAAGAAELPPEIQKIRETLSKTDQKILEALQGKKLSMDEITLAVGITAAEAMQELMLLEISGLVEFLPGNHYHLK